MSQDVTTAFYAQLFRLLDTKNTGILQGSQSFQFFISSNLNKSLLADIWDEVTLKQSNGLNFLQFVTMMKLISLAQRNIQPKLKNLQNNKNISTPIMSYPPSIQRPEDNNDNLNFVTPQINNQTSNEQLSNTNLYNKNLTNSTFDNDDVFNSNDNSTKNNQPLQMVSYPSCTSSVTSDDSSLQKSETTVESATTTANNENNNNDINNNSSYGNNLSLTISRSTSPFPKLMYSDERIKEELRAADAREKLLRQQLNQARIDNEKLAKENEDLQLQAKKVCEQQLQAFQQTNEALKIVQPVTSENQQLKTSVLKLQQLLSNKNKEFVELTKEFEILQTENNENSNIIQQEKMKYADLQFQFQKLQAKLNEAEDKNKLLLNEIKNLKQDKMLWESKKQEYILIIGQLEDELKLFKHKTKLQIKGKQHDIDPNALTSNTNPKTTISNLSDEKNIESLSKVKNDIITNTTVNNQFIKPKTSEDKNSSMKTPTSTKLPFTTISINDFDFDDQYNVEFPTFGDDDTNNLTNGNITSAANTTNSNNDKQGNKPYSSKYSTPNGDKGENIKKETMDIHNNNNIEKENDEYEEIETIIMENYETEEEVETTINEETEIWNEEEKIVIYNGDEFKENGNNPWYLSNEDKIKYKTYFINADTNKDGIIQPQEAFEFFMKSQLGKTILGKIWTIVYQAQNVNNNNSNHDDNKNIGLNEYSFYAMFHIVYNIKKYYGSIECPNQLPPCLTNEVIGKLGSSIYIKSKTKQSVVKPIKKKEIQKIQKQKPIKKIIKIKKEKNVCSNDNDKNNKTDCNNNNGINGKSIDDLNSKENVALGVDFDNFGSFNW